MESIGIGHDKLTTGQIFMHHHQGTGKAVRYIHVMDVKKLYNSDESSIGQPEWWGMAKAITYIH